MHKTFPELYSGRSLGLGSQVSQVSAVLYANDLDHYIKETLRIKEYGRYMDDGYLLVETYKKAKRILSQIISFCESHGLVINQNKTKIIKLSQGFKFLKVRYVFLNSGLLIKQLSRENLTRTRRKLKKLHGLLEQKKMELADIVTSYGSWQGYALRRGGRRAYFNMNQLFKKLFNIPAPKCILE